MPKSYRLPALAALVLYAFALQAQTDNAPAAKIAEQLSQYVANNPRLKTFVHTDKPYYLPGDTLWYAAYAVAGPQQIPDTLTGIVHVELYYLSNNQVIAQHKTALKGGRGAGQITIADSLPGGDYGLRAYSNFMRNYGERDFFQRRIAVYNPKKMPEAASYNDPAALADCQFFPEGGQLLANVNQRIAFKAVNKAGNGVTARGWVLSPKNDTLVTFTTDHLGLGTFYGKFLPDTPYKAVVSDGTTTQTYNLPVASAAGYALSVDNLSSKTNVKVYITNTKPQNEGTLTLVVQTRGIASAISSLPANKPGQTILLPRADFSDGIAQITLFDPQGAPVCERLIFLQKEGPLNVTVSTDQPTYGGKGAVTATITAADAAGKPVSGQFSVAVTSGNQVLIDPASDNLVSYLWLSSDVRGRIEQPARYFDPANANARIQLDLLLLTQGWRQFTWKDVMAAPKEITYAHYLETGLGFTGKVERFNGKPLTKPVSLSLMLVAGKYRQVMFGEANPTGLFAVSQLNFTDTASLIVQTMVGQAKRDFKVTLDDNPPPPFLAKNTPSFAWKPDLTQLKEALDEAEAWQAYIKRIAAANDILLKTVEISEKKVEQTDSRRNVYGEADNTLKITPDMVGGAINPLQMLQGRVAGVQVNCNGIECSVLIRGITSISGNNSPLFLIDGVTVSEDAINGLSPNDIEAIDVIKNGAAFGSQGAAGAINFLTKRANINYDYTGEKAAGMNNFKVKGYAPTRQYYVPKYDVADSPERSRQDRRPTVYWNPAVQTGADGKATVRFFTNDEDGAFHFSVQGWSADGKPGIGRGTYQTKPR